MNVIQHPKTVVRGRLAIFAHTLPELMAAEAVYDDGWLARSRLNLTIGLSVARRLGLPNGPANLKKSPDSLGRL